MKMIACHLFVAILGLYQFHRFACQFTSFTKLTWYEYSYDAEENYSYLTMCFTLPHQQYPENHFYLPLLEFEWPQYINLNMRLILTNFVLHQKLIFIENKNKKQSRHCHLRLCFKKKINCRWQIRLTSVLYHFSKKKSNFFIIMVLILMIV